MSSLASNLSVRVRSAIVFGALFLGTYCLSLLLSKNIFSLLLGAIFLFLLVVEWPQFCKKDRITWLLTPIYPIIPMIALIYLNHEYSHYDYLFPLYPFFISWAADTGGYIFGKRWGVHKLAPKISPKKSWEGLVGSIIFVLILNLLLIPLLLFGFFPVIKKVLIGSGLIGIIMFPVIFAVCALAGDLVESYLKRRAGIKDSGSIMPGHGGLFDRFDSVFFVGMGLCLYLFK